MRYLAALLALAALGGCGVDGQPQRPGEDPAAAEGRKATPEPEQGKWITGTVSKHVGVTL